ncbi:hypothetical protein ACFVUN_23800 [Kitasatospora griseola]|uniref:hypothetical protein n=1 Tax=Kitasatospora griseola TaxID=2064 RepID=UPI0036D97E4D
MSDVSGGMSGFVYNVVAAAATTRTAAMVALAGQVGGGAVKVEVENLQTFKNKVDQILRELDDSVASRGEVSQQTLATGQLGQNFNQADDLMTAYNTVHATLERLSQSLAAQIAAMSASIGKASGNYSNADAEQEARFRPLYQPGTVDPRTAYRPQTPATGTQQGAY